VLVVGQAPAADGWLRTGKAFIKSNGEMLQTGKNLNKLLRKIGLSLNECAYTELVKCYRGKNSSGYDKAVLSGCVRGCWPIFERQLGTGDFGLLVLLGRPVLDAFKKKTKAPLVMGRLSDVELSDSLRKVLSIYHPVHIYPPSARENLHIFEELGNDLRTLLTEMDPAG
jgi:uracil-DNA glycosylase family 4